MPSLAAAKAANLATKLDSPISVVVGGTSGIGAALAVKLAQYSTNPTIYIVGRSASAAEKVMADMKQVNPQGTYDFHKCDVTLLSQIDPVVTSLCAALPLITHLILTPGILTTQSRTPASPEESNDVKMMLHYYSRMFFTRGLMPSLEAAAAQRGTQTSKVMSVLDSKRGDLKALDWGDLDLRKTYSLRRVANHCLVMTDVSMQRFAKNHPTVSFIHAYPGFVNTNISTNLPSYIRYPAGLLGKALGTPSLDCGDWLFAGMQRSAPNDKAGKAGDEGGKPRFIDNRGDDIVGKMLASEEQMEEVWEHTEDIIDKRV